MPPARKTIHQQQQPIPSFLDIQVATSPSSEIPSAHYLQLGELSVLENLQVALSALQAIDTASNEDSDLKEAFSLATACSVKSAKLAQQIRERSHAHNESILKLTQQKAAENGARAAAAEVKVAKMETRMVEQAKELEVLRGARRKDEETIRAAEVSDICCDTVFRVDSNFTGIAGSDSDRLAFPARIAG